MNETKAVMKNVSSLNFPGVIAKVSFVRDVEYADDVDNNDDDKSLSITAKPFFLALLSNNIETFVHFGYTMVRFRILLNTICCPISSSC